MRNASVLWSTNSSAACAMARSCCWNPARSWKAPRPKSLRRCRWRSTSRWSIRADLATRGTLNVDFKVDPKILGGLVVRVGDRVVDASVSGQLESLKQSLS